MISANFFHQVSERISKAKAWDPASGDKPFGGHGPDATGKHRQLVFSQISKTNQYEYGANTFGPRVT